VNKLMNASMLGLAPIAPSQTLVSDDEERPGVENDVNSLRQSMREWRRAKRSAVSAKSLMRVTPGARSTHIGARYC